MLKSNKLSHNRKLCIFEVSCIDEVFSEINNFLEETNIENCWIAFDIDYTLTMPALEINGVINPISKESIFSVLIKLKNREKIDRFISSTVFLPQVLIDNRSPKIIKKLQQKQIKVFALTSCLYKKNIEQHRLDTLSKLNINFKNAFNISKILLDGISVYQGEFPVYSEGILYVNGENGLHNKGTVLKEFIRKIEKIPSHFVIVDDRRKNIEDLYKIFSEKYPSTKFLGILYIHKQEIEKISPNVIISQIQIRNCN